MKLPVLHRDMFPCNLIGCLEHLPLPEMPIVLVHVWRHILPVILLLSHGKVNRQNVCKNKKISSVGNQIIVIDRLNLQK
jgi:hypothetical protein